MVGSGDSGAVGGGAVTGSCGGAFDRAAVLVPPTFADVREPEAERFGPMSVYGSDALAIQELVQTDPSLGEPLHRALPYTRAEVVWAARHELARTVEDVLARRVRALFLNAAAATEMAPETAAILAKELGRDESWQRDQVESFVKLATQYRLGR